MNFFRCIAIPSDLELAVKATFSKAQILSRQSTYKWRQQARSQKRDLAPSISSHPGGIVIEGLQDIVSVLEEHLKPLVQAKN